MAVEKGTFQTPQILCTKLCNSKILTRCRRRWKRGENVLPRLIDVTLCIPSLEVSYRERLHCVLGLHEKEIEARGTKPTYNSGKTLAHAKIALSQFLPLERTGNGGSWDYE